MHAASDWFLSKLSRLVEIRTLMIQHKARPTEEEAKGLKCVGYQFSMFVYNSQLGVQWLLTT